jgi:uncharacterized protein (TIGR00251 family)
LRPVIWRCSTAFCGSRVLVEGRSAIKLRIKVVPSSSRNAIDGWLGDTLKVRVTAPPERGKANAAVETIIADAIGVPSQNVRVASGQTSARKIVEIVGLSEAEVHRRLEKSDQDVRDRSS